MAGPESEPYQSTRVTWPAFTRVEVTWSTARSELTPAGEAPPLTSELPEEA